MALEIKQLEPTRSNLLKFVHYPIDYLYQDNEYYVPNLVNDEINTLRPDKNPAFKFCESIYFMAYRDGKPVGRIAGIINMVVNKREGKKTARFGYVDFIDDDEVVDGLMNAVIDWAKEKGMNFLTGPLGFTDLDPEGCLIDGFDQLNTQATIYNHAYYPKQFDRVGFKKDTDWVEFKVTVPENIPEKMQRIASIAKQRCHVHSVHITNRKHLVMRYGEAIFNLINEAYDSLFGYSPLTEEQVEHYIKLYLPFLPLDHISIIVSDEDESLVGVGISIPSLSKALIKGRGRLLPFGWFHLLRSIKGHTEIVDLMLIAVKPQLQKMGINTLMFNDLIPVYNKHHYKYAETNIELEDNMNVQQQWDYFENILHKRRRAYIKSI